MELTKEDLELLMQSIDAWLDQESSTEFSVAMLGVMFAATKEEREKSMLDSKARMEKASKSKAIKSERATLIKAKLIQMKQSVTADAVFNEARESK
jgi:hypothetical protein